MIPSSLLRLMDHRFLPPLSLSLCFSCAFTLMTVLTHVERVRASESGVVTSQESQPWIQPGDRVVLIGHGWVERMHHHPWLEMLATLQVPGVTFRNIGWSGDTVYGDARAVFGARPDGYQRLLRDLDYAAPTLAIVCYGENEAFGTEAERAEFVAGYRKLLMDLKKRDCRCVLMIPRFREKVGGGFPDPARYNAQLDSIAKEIRSLANEFQFGLIDLSGFAAGQRFTEDGVNWSDEGYQLSAIEMMRQLGYTKTLRGEQLRETMPSKIGELKKRVQAKNEWFFHRYRPQNETYLFLFRKHEQGNNAPEVEQMERHVEEGERAILEWMQQNQVAPKAGA